MAHVNGSTGARVQRLLTAGTIAPVGSMGAIGSPTKIDGVVSLIFLCAL